MAHGMTYYFYPVNHLSDVWFGWMFFFLRCSGKTVQEISFSEVDSVEVFYGLVYSLTFFHVVFVWL